MISDMFQISRMNTLDWQFSGIFFLVLISIIAVFEFLYSQLNFPVKYTRKAVHIFVGLAVVASSFFIQSALPIMILTGLFSVTNLYMIRNRIFGSMHAGSMSLGTFYYPLSIFCIAAVFWETQPIVFRTGVLLLAIPDALAAIIGDKYGKRKFIVLDDSKSFIGSMTMFISGWIILYSGFDLLFADNIPLNILFALIVAVTVTVAEIVSTNGSDNLSVPLVGTFLFFGYAIGDGAFQERLMIGQILAILVGYISFRFKFLSDDGAATAFILGSFIFGFGGMAATVPILTFFILSSLLSKVGKRYKKEVENNYEKSSVRDAAQVLANGGIGGILIIILAFADNEAFYILYAVSIAIATADTWSTELGIFSKQKPRLITNLKKVLPGTSGAISLTGTIAGIAGATIIALSTLIFFKSAHFVQSAMIIVFGGFIGNLADSLIGATIQAKFKCVQCTKITEKRIHCDKKATLNSGYSFLNNDVVNILAILTGTAISSLYFL